MHFMTQAFWTKNFSAIHLFHQLRSIMKRFVAITKPIPQHQLAMKIMATIRFRSMVSVLFKLILKAVSHRKRFEHLYYCHDVSFHLILPSSCSLDRITSISDLLQLVQPSSSWKQYGNRKITKRMRRFRSRQFFLQLRSPRF